MEFFFCSMVLCPIQINREWDGEKNESDDRAWDGEGGEGWHAVTERLESNLGEAGEIVN